jgi:hypothetical protein
MSKVSELPLLGTISIPVRIEVANGVPIANFAFFKYSDCGCDVSTDDGKTEIGTIMATMGGHTEISIGKDKEWKNLIIDVETVWNAVHDLVSSEAGVEAIRQAAEEVQAKRLKESEAKEAARKAKEVESLDAQIAALEKEVE